LNEQAVGQEVTVCGWANVVRDQSHQMFIDLRDRSGIVQCVVDRDQNEALHDASQGIRAEYCLRITGTVQTRLPGKENPKVPTGNIEVQAREVEILNTAKTPPFEIVDDTRASEDVRLQYRYLDLRRKADARCPRTAPPPGQRHARLSRRRRLSGKSKRRSCGNRRPKARANM
jgi:aspartyl-tRNA synthetase